MVTVVSPGHFSSIISNVKGECCFDLVQLLHSSQCHLVDYSFYIEWVVSLPPNWKN